MKAVVSSTMALLLAVLPFGTVFGQQTFETFMDPNGLFSLKYPSDWEIYGLDNDDTFEKIESVEFILRDKVSDQSVISVARTEDEPKEVGTLEDVRIYHIARLSDGNVEMLNSSQTALSGQEAFRIYFHRPADEVTPEYTQPANDVLMITAFDPDLHKSFTLRYGALPALFSENESTCISCGFLFTGKSS